jgi:hypothetical protein
MIISLLIIRGMEAIKASPVMIAFILTIISLTSNTVLEKLIYMYGFCRY